MKQIAVVTRGSYVESIHYGYICVSDDTGKVLYNLGSPDAKIYFRSSAKPIQVIPFIESGAAEAYGFTLKDIAIACASHSGQEMHQNTVTEMLHKVQLNPEHLHCGIAQPYNKEESMRLSSHKQAPSVLHCSCSGKHTAMLALARYKGYSIHDYETLSHPVQQEALKMIAYFAEEDPASIAIGIDGCGLPIFVLPMRKIAMTYAKLMKYAEDIHQPYHKACKMVVDAMTAHPEMVSGDQEFCGELMKGTSAKLIGKVGAEAVYCIGIKKKNIGICIKILDGNERAVYPVVIHTLIQMGILNKEEQEMLQDWHIQKIKNNLDQNVGEIVPVFTLDGEYHEYTLGEAFHK